MNVDTKMNKVYIGYEKSEHDTAQKAVNSLVSGHISGILMYALDDKHDALSAASELVKHRKVIIDLLSSVDENHEYK